MNMIESIRSALDYEMEHDADVLVLGQDVADLGGVFRATDGLLDTYGPDRVVDMPLAEAAIVGSTVGLAIAGFRPVAEIQFLGFTHQAFHQLGPQLGRMRYRSQGRYPMPVTIRAPFGGGVRTPELHSDAIEAQFVQCPGLKVVMPATARDAKGLLLASIRDDDPVLFCEPLRGYRSVKGDVPDGDYEVPLGKARVAREGTDITVVAWSAAVQVAEHAATELEEEHDISCQVLDLRSLVPFDVETLVDAVASTGKCLVVHEAPLTAGFGAEVMATLADEAFYYLEAPLRRVTAPDTPYPFAGVEDQYIPNAAKVTSAVLQMMRDV